MKKMCKVLCVLLSLALLSSLTVAAFATEAEVPEPQDKSVKIRVIPEEELPENGELFDLFVQRELYGYDMAVFGTAARGKLNAMEQAIYDELRAGIEAVAVSGGSTVFALPEVAGLKTKWTNQELGVTSIEDFSLIDDAFFAQFSLDAILSALMNDCPFDLYWYDKTWGVAVSYQFEMSNALAGDQYVIDSVSVTDLSFAFTVSEDYASGENTVTTDVAKITAVRNTAAQVVADNAGKSNYEKLLAYKTYICDTVSYNDAAAYDPAIHYGDPWQLIYVFDKDPATEVVCEGYSKAFMYLCDLSSFTGDTACYTVSGQMNGGNHMWNIVTIGGRNYLADVTNSDTGSIGQDGSLFMAGASGTVTGGYRVNDILYTYDYENLYLWGTEDDSVLCLSAEKYVPGMPEETRASVTRVYGANRYDTAIKAADTLKEQLGVEKFSAVVVASGEGFADALSGSYLAAVKDAPFMLVRNNKNTINQVKDYIRANLASGGTVYLLGGENAVPKSMETGLEGFAVKRLGGATRYATNLLILEEAGVSGKDVLVCTGNGFADSLSASAAKQPILLVKTSLDASQKEFLSKVEGKLYIIGGTSAVNTQIENQLKAYGDVKRLGGATRYITSVMVAEEFFDAPRAAVLAYSDNFPDGLSGGALACGVDAPLILTKGGKDSVAAEYTKRMGIRDGFILGGPTLIADRVVRNVFSMGANDPIAVK